MSEQHINGRHNLNCVYDPDSHQELKEVLSGLKVVLENLDKHLTGVTSQLIGPATNKGYIPVETHNRIVILTVLIFGGVELIKYVIAK